MANATETILFLQGTRPFTGVSVEITIIEDKEDKTKKTRFIKLNKSGSKGVISMYFSPKDFQEFQEALQGLKI